MRKRPGNPAITDVAPSDPTGFAPYDHEHAATYLRMLDAEADGADWREVALILLHIDPAQELERARQAYESYLARAKWMTQHGYKLMLKGSGGGGRG